MEQSIFKVFPKEVLGKKHHNLRGFTLTELLDVTAKKKKKRIEIENLRRKKKVVASNLHPTLFIRQYYGYTGLYIHFDNALSERYRLFTMKYTWT